MEAPREIIDHLAAGVICDEFPHWCNERKKRASIC
jgi:hypothetical protein